MNRRKKNNTIRVCSALWANPIVALVLYFVSVGGLDDRYCRCMENGVCCFALKARITRKLQVDYKNKKNAPAGVEGANAPQLFIIHYSFFIKKTGFGNYQIKFEHPKPLAKPMRTYPQKRQL